MRSMTWMLVALGLLAAPLPSEQAGFRVVSDDDWCRNDGEWGFRRARHCEIREVTWRAQGPVHVDARPNGGISVRGWDSGDVRLRVKVEATGQTEAEARALAEQVRIETGADVRAVGPGSSGGDRWWVSFRLEAPRDTGLRLEADNGGIHIDDMTGSSEFKTVNGGIHLKGVGGRVHGQTVNGGLHVELSGTEWQGEALDLRTTNGGVHLQLPADYNARLEAGTVNGGVHSFLPVAGRRRGRSGGRIDAELGRGGALVRLETTNGGLHVDRQ